MHRIGSMRSLRSLLSYSQTGFARSISSTPCLESFGWMDKLKGVLTGKKPSLDSTAPSFSLTDFADQMEKARGVGLLKKFEVGRCSEATMADAFKKQSSILRYLGNIDPSGENLQPSHKQEATKHCNCTISEVEHILSKYKWAKDAQKKIDKLKEEGKPLPKSFSEDVVQVSPAAITASDNQSLSCKKKAAQTLKAYDISLNLADLNSKGKANQMATSLNKHILRSPNAEEIQKKIQHLGSSSLVQF